MTDPHPAPPQPRSTAVGLLMSADLTAFGQANDGRLPYRIDQLSGTGSRLLWTDRHRHGSWQWRPLARLVHLSERVLAPWSQTFVLWRASHPDVWLAMFESEGHFLALAHQLLPRARRRPLLVVACWLGDLALSGGRLRRRLYSRIYRGVDGVVVFSENQLSVLQELLGIDRDRIHVVRFAIDLSELDRRTTSDGGAVVAVGRDLGRDWKTLALAATGTGWDVRLATREAQLNGLDLPPEVTPVGFLNRERYLDLLADASVVALPSELRAYPTGQTVLLEAMALGKACVTTDSPAIRDYVDNGRDAVLVPPHDHEALRSAIDELLADPDRRRELGEAARARVLADGGTSRMWREVGDHLQTISGAGSPVPPPS